MKWVLSIIIVLNAAGGLSQTFKDVGEVLEYANKNSTVARQGNILRQVGTEDVSIAKSGLLPKINIIGTAEYAPIIPSQVIPESIFGGQDDKFRKVQFGMPWNFSGGLELNMPVINFEKWDQLRKARLQASQVNWNQKARLEDLHNQVAQAYYQVLIAKEMIRLNNENSTVIGQLMEMMEERRINGVLEPADYNRAKNLELNIQTAGNDYQHLYEMALINLRSLLNIPGKVKITITDSLKFFAWPATDLNYGAQYNKAAWKETVAGTEVAKQGVAESRSANLPKLSLYSRYLYNWQMDNSQTIHFDASAIGMKLDFPIFNGGYKRHQQKKAELLLKSAYMNQQQVESGLLKQQQQWWSFYQHALNNKTINETKVSVAMDNLRIAGLNIKEGVIEFDTYNNIFLEYNRSRLEELQNLSDGILYHFLLTHNL